MAYLPSQQHAGMPNQRVQEMLDFVCLIWGQLDLGQFHDYCTTHSKEEVLRTSSEIRRNSTLPNSQHSSLISIRSYISSNSADSRDSMLYATPSTDPSYHVERNPDQSTRDSFTPFANLSASSYPASQNQDSPCSQFTTPGPYSEVDENVSHFCITCRKIYKDKYGLGKHRSHQCESQKFWVCSRCSYRCGRKDKLKAHFNTHGGETCGNDCEFRGKDSCSKHQPSIDVDAASRPRPPKRAWGCPVCASCFDTGDEWHEHEKTHRKDVRVREQRETDVPVDGWSERQLIESLLKSKRLQDAVQLISNDIWKSCHWPGKKENKEAFGNLIFALERHTLPDNLQRLATPDELIKYALQIGMPSRPMPWHGAARIENCLTSARPVLSPSSQRHAAGLVRSQPAGNSAYQPNDVQMNVTAMQAGIHQEWAFEFTDAARETGHVTQPGRQYPITPRLLPEPQKAKGLFGPVKNLIKVKSSAFRIQEVASSPNLPPSWPPILPTQRSQMNSEFPPRQESLTWSLDEASIRTTAQRNETPLHGHNDNHITGALRFNQNIAKPFEDKRSSLMSIDDMPFTDTEHQQHRSIPAGFDTTPVPFEDFCQPLFEEYTNSDDY